MTSVGVTAWAAVRAAAVGPGDTVVVTGAAGGVGHIAAQMAVAYGARTLGTARPRDFDFLRSIGVVPVEFGEGLGARLRTLAPTGIDAWVDTSGHGSVALAVELGVSPVRIDTIIDGAAADQFGARIDGHAAGMSAEAVDELMDLLSGGRVVVRVGARLPLAQVVDAYRRLEASSGGGKIILQIGSPFD